ncbi:Zn-dependent alcohol dehydrogenase [Candidatus Poriferisocius sp.]|uniref:Zn-dependent alcohol dehydrogenase n=1 Tax=Candidatus Poriferisocius sp. TaxID=3101276 RepID=UPI003B0114D6
MLAAIMREVGRNTLDVCDEVEMLDLGPDDVAIKITHTGVCHSDVSAMNGTIPQAPPAVLGHEGAGIIEEVGSNVDDLAPGDHVIVVWSPPCGACVYCTGRNQPNLCSAITFGSMARMKFRQGGQDIGGMAGAGTFAEKMLMPRQGVVKIDPDIPLDVASLIGCGVMTGAGAAMNTARITPGSSVMVIGAGGVGVAAIQGARIAGAAEIVAVDKNPAKLDEAIAFGATHAVGPDDLEGAKNEITGGEGFDYALECVGVPALMRTAYDMTRRGGTCCIVGVGRLEEMVSFNAFELFYNEKTLVGSYYGGTDARTDFHRLLRLWKHGKLDLERMITRRITLDEINPALEAVRNGEVVRQVVEF